MKKALQHYFALLPIAYLFISIFIARSKVEYVYAATIVLIILTAISLHRQKLKSVELLAKWMLVLAAIGIAAAVILSIEKVAILAEPTRVTSCSLSPIVTCSPVITSPQASAFGFANPFIGIFGFAAVFTAAMTILAGATKLSKLWWRTLLGGITFGAAFCIWLIHEGVYEIGALCLYCMLVWLVTFTLFWFVISYCVENKFVSLGPKVNKLLSYRNELIAANIVLIFALILFRWADYWRTLF